MQNLKNLSQWETLPKNKPVVFPSIKSGAREVRLEINAPLETQIFVVEETNEKPIFLALVKGRETLRFSYIGNLTIICPDENVQIYTSEMEFTYVENDPDSEKFTTLMDRKPRNPELELMMRKMQENNQRNLARQQRELDAVRAEALEIIRAERQQKVEPNEPDTESSPEPKPADTTQDPATEVSKSQGTDGSPSIAEPSD